MSSSSCAALVICPWCLGLIGLLILLTSCINFISLVTARGSARGKEIGIRKSHRCGQTIHNGAIWMGVNTAFLMIFHQLQYVHEKDLGVDRKNVLYVRLEGELYSQLPVYSH